MVLPLKISDKPNAMHSELYMILPFGTLVLLLISATLRANSAERREKQYKKICDDLTDALRNQGEALENLMAAHRQNDKLSGCRAETSTDTPNP